MPDQPASPDVPLDSSDLESWAAFLSTVRVGGALPVIFWMDGNYVVVEMTVPYVAPARTESDPRWIDTPAGQKIQRIPITIADGFPVPIAGRYRLPPYASTDAPEFIRGIVREIYLHEIDEQLRIGDDRPFAPDH